MTKSVLFVGSKVMKMTLLYAQHVQVVSMWTAMNHHLDIYQGNVQFVNRRKYSFYILIKRNRVKIMCCFLSFRSAGTWVCQQCKTGVRIRTRRKSSRQSAGIFLHLNCHNWLIGSSCT